MKMGTIASPWRYDGLSKFAQSLAEMSVGSQKHHVAAHRSGMTAPEVTRCYRRRGISKTNSPAFSKGN